MSIKIDMNGKWEYINAHLIENGKLTYGNLPPKIRKELLAETITHLDEKFKNKILYRLSNTDDRYIVSIRTEGKRYQIYFSEGGDYLRMLEYVDVSE